MPASRKSARRLWNLRQKNLGPLRRRRTLRLEALESRLALVGDIVGTVFGDLNSNGLFEPLAGEVGAANQLVYLDANSSGTLDTGEARMLTTGTGTYAFPGEADGSYNVRLVLDAVTDQTVPTINAGPNPFATLPNIVDHVFDGTTGIDYAATSAGNITITSPIGFRGMATLLRSGSMSRSSVHRVCAMRSSPRRAPP